MLESQAWAIPERGSNTNCFHRKRRGRRFHFFTWRPFRRRGRNLEQGPCSTWLSFWSARISANIILMSTKASSLLEDRAPPDLTAGISAPFPTFIPSEGSGDTRLKLQDSAARTLQTQRR